MMSAIDAEGTDRHYGWTKEADGTVWYWSVSLDDGTVRFTDRGLPSDHPLLKTGEIPDRIKTHAEEYADTWGPEVED